MNTLRILGVALLALLPEALRIPTDEWAGKNGGG